MTVNELGEGLGLGSFSRREEPSMGELVAQQRCEHRWVIFAMAAGSSGFEFRHCPRCGKKAWVSPEGPVELDQVLKVLARGRGQQLRRSER